MRLLYGTVMLLFLVVFTESRREYCLPNFDESGMSKDAEENCTAGIHNWFTKDELKLCNFYKLKGIVEEAIAMALKHCQKRFRDRRWNCSELNTTKVLQRQGIMKKGMRESAFVYAIISATVVYKVTMLQCTQVNWEKCGCFTGRKFISNGFLDWKECSKFNEFLKYGEEVSRHYMDPPKHDELSLLIQHNNEAGRQALKNRLEVECKVYSGGFASGGHRFCWIRLPSRFRRVSENLRKRFERSRRVRANRTLERYTDKRRPSKKALVYTDQSPNFCRAEPSLGTAGTRGRLCKKIPYGREGCNSMCCGRGFTTTTRSTKTKCTKCKSTWLCKSQCKLCYKKEIEHRCK